MPLFFWVNAPLGRGHDRSPQLYLHSLLNYFHPLVNYPRKLGTIAHSEPVGVHSIDLTLVRPPHLNGTTHFHPSGEQLATYITIHHYLRSSGQSGCVDGWAALKDSRLVSASWIRLMVGNWDMSTLNLKHKEYVKMYPKQFGSCYLQWHK